MNFTKITPTSQRGKAIIRSYENSDIYTLREAYAYSYSRAKERAYDDCVAMMNELNGYGLRITGACGTNFSVGFVFVNDDGKKCLAYITYRNNYVIPDYDE